MTDEDRVRLLQVQDALRKALALVSGISHEQYTAAESFGLRAATERFLEIAGRATHHVSSGLKAQHPDIPWQQIAGMREHLVHGYMTTNDELVLKAAVEDAPRFLAKLATFQLDPALTVHPHPSPLPEGEGTGSEPGYLSHRSGNGARAGTGKRAMIPTQEYVLEELHRVRPMLRTFSVRRVAVFGSVARNTARADSDIDILVDFSPEDKTAANFFGLQEFLEDLFHRKVDVITESGLKPFSRDLVMRDAVFLEGLHEAEAVAEKLLAKG